MTNITVNEAPKELPSDAGGGTSFKGFTKQESDSITTVGLGLAALVGGYLVLNYLDAQGFISQALGSIGVGNNNSPSGTVPEGTSTASDSESDYARARAYAARANRSPTPVITDFAKYSPDLTDISGDVEYKLHSDDTNIGAIEDPDDQYYYENADFSPGRSAAAAYPATLEHDPRSDIQQSYLGQEDGVMSYVSSESGSGSSSGDDIVSYVSEELVPSDLSKYRVERDNLGNLLDVSVDA